RRTVSGGYGARGHAASEIEIARLAIDIIDQRILAIKSELDAVAAVLPGGIELERVRVPDEVADLRVAQVLVTLGSKVGEQLRLKLGSGQAHTARGQPAQSRRNLRFVPAARFHQ